MKKTDVIIIGAGPVGLFAVHQLGIKGLKAVVIDNKLKKGGYVSHTCPFFLIKNLLWKFQNLIKEKEKED